LVLCRMRWDTSLAQPGALVSTRFRWLHGLDLNQRPLGYECAQSKNGRGDRAFQALYWHVIFAPISALFGIVWEQNRGRL